MENFISTIKAAQRVGMSLRQFKRVASDARECGLNIGGNRLVYVWTPAQVDHIREFYLTEWSLGKRKPRRRFIEMAEGKA